MSELIEIDGRQSGEIYYQLTWHVASNGLALIAKERNQTRAVHVPSDKGLDAMNHPESGEYLGGTETIYDL